MYNFFNNKLGTLLTATSLCLLTSYESVLHSDEVLTDVDEKELLLEGNDLENSNIEVGVNLKKDGNDITEISNYIAMDENFSNNDSKNKGSFENVKPLGSVYVTMTVGYGRLSSKEPQMLASPLVDLFTSLTNTTIKKGGVSYRGSAGFLVDITNHTSLGIEAGFSYYASSKFRMSLGGSSIDLSVFGSLLSDDYASLFSSYDIPTIYGNLTQHAYGVDFLSNLTVYCIPQLYLSFKPGIQLSYQSNRINMGLDVNKITKALDFKNKYTSLALLPEVVLACGWEFIYNKASLTLEINYQHVFGRDFSAVGTLINSRDMIGFGIGFRY